MTPTFNLDGDYLLEQARIAYPDSQVFYYTDSEFAEAIKQYEAHVKTLRRIRIHPDSVWSKTEGLVEGVDFNIEQRTDPNDTDTEQWTKPYAVPIASQPQRSEESYWEDVAIAFSEHEDKREAIEYLKQHYTLTTIKK